MNCFRPALTSISGPDVTKILSEGGLVGSWFLTEFEEIKKEVLFSMQNHPGHNTFGSWRRIRRRGIRFD